MKSSLLVKTLRIKKIFFDKILSGEKKIEYRDYRPYYENLLLRELPSHLFLHYQKPRQALVEVTAIKVVPTPEFLKGGAIKFGPRVIEIHLGNSREIKNTKLNL